MSTSVSLGTVTDHHAGYGARPRICHRAVRHRRSGPNRTNWARRPQKAQRTSVRAGCMAPTGSTGRGGRWIDGTCRVQGADRLGLHLPRWIDGLGLRRPRWTDETFLICMVVSLVAIAVTFHRCAGRVDEHTRARGNFLGTMIPYAGATV